MNNKIIKLALGLILGLSATQGMAVPTIGASWGSGVGNLVDPVWTTVDLPGSIPSPTSATAVGSQSVTLTFPTGGNSPYASLFTTQANYLGNYAGLGGNLSIRFTFNPQDYPPNSVGGLGFYFRNGANIWYANDVTTPLVTGPQSYSFNIGSLASWTADIGNVADWATAFQNVQEIGFTVLGANQNSQQRYAFSDVNLFLNVPEPETLWMLAIVLASLGITFRGRLSELAGQVKARIKA